MSRPRSTLAIAALSLLTLVTACSDASVAPATAPSASLLSGPTVTDSGTHVFSVGPWGGKIGFGNGNYRVDFPANAICDPATTAYGITEWDQPCETLKTPITITAVYKTVNGHPQVTFSPDLRFAPTASTDPSDHVMIYMKDKIVDEAQFASVYNILWKPTGSLVPVDESLTDPSVRTRFKFSSWSVYRRLKHFSGYQVGSGADDYYYGY